MLGGGGGTDQRQVIRRAAMLTFRHGNHLQGGYTAMIALLLRLLPNAEIYVVRVARDAEGLSTAKGSIEDVIGSRPG